MSPGLGHGVWGAEEDVKELAYSMSICLSGAKKKVELKRMSSSECA